MNFELWLAFTLVAFLATAIPGPAMLLVSSHSLSYGLKKTFFTILGNVTGLAILSGLSVIGLSQVIIHSFVIFTFIKIFGAVYLIYLGVKLIRFGLSPLSVNIEAANRSKFFMYGQGILLSFSNPKAILFTTALFPQFIDPSINLYSQFLVLVTTFVVLSFCCLTTCAILVRFSMRKVVSSKVYTTLGKVFGGLFIGAGGVLLASTRGSA